MPIRPAAAPSRACRRCQGLALSDCVGGAASTFPIPDDTTEVPESLSPFTDLTSDHMIPAGPGRMITLYGGTLTGVSVPVHDSAPLIGTDDFASVVITY